MLSRYRRCRFGYPRVILTYTVRREPSGYFRRKLCGDLEYHPWQAALYFALAVAAFCFWIFSPSKCAIHYSFSRSAPLLCSSREFFSCANRLRVSDYRTKNSLTFPTQPIARGFHVSELPTIRGLMAMRRLRGPMLTPLCKPSISAIAGVEL